MVRSCVTLLKIRNGSEYWALARNLPGRKSGIFGRSSFRDDRLPAGSSLEKSGDATMGAAGSTRSSLSTRTMNDRRSIGRTKIAKEALLFFGGQTGVRSCGVTDITNAGAGIRTQDLPAIPLYFELSFDKFRTSRNCRLIWRDGDFVGVAFES
jgi:hypothetical protein